MLSADYQLPERPAENLPEAPRHLLGQHLDNSHLQATRLKELSAWQSCIFDRTQ